MKEFAARTHDFTINLEEGLKRCPIGSLFAVGDDKADSFRLILSDNGDTLDLTGCTVTGYFIRADQVTVRNAGNAVGSIAEVTLEKACYVAEGAFSFAVNIRSAEGISRTVAVFDGRTVQTQTDNVIVDEGTVVPDLDELLAQIDAMEKATAEAEAIADKVPYIGETGYWFEWKKENGGYVDTGVPAQGAKGETGEPGASGANGADGISPVVTVEAITGGHRVTITDKNGAQSFDVLNGTGSGTGDMLKSVYDSTGNGIVDNAEKLGGKSPDEFAPSAHAHEGYAPSTHAHDAMTGASAENAGAAGFVPAPSAGDEAKFLRGDGTWAKASNGTADQVMIDGTAYTLRTGTEGAEGYITFVLEA